MGPLFFFEIVLAVDVVLVNSRLASLRIPAITKARLGSLETVEGGALSHVSCYLLFFILFLFLFYCKSPVYFYLYFIQANNARGSSPRNEPHYYASYPMV